MVRAAIGQIVAIDAGDDDVAEVHVTRHAGDVGGLGGIEAHVMLAGVEFADAAEAAAAGAELAEDHEGGGAAMEALVDIGAARLLADGVEIELAEAAFQVIERFEMGLAFARPFGQTGAFGRRSAVADLDERTQSRLVPHGPEAGIFQLGLGAAHGLGIGEGSDEDAGEIVDAGSERRLENLYP